LLNQVLESLDLHKLQDLVSLFKQRYAGHADIIKPDVIAREFIPLLFKSIGWRNGETSALIILRGTRQGLPYFGLEIGREVKAVVFACGKQTRENTEVVADIAVLCQHRQDIYDTEAFSQLFEQFLNEMRLVLGGGGAH
jgi:hypothetical protein